MSDIRTDLLSAFREALENDDELQRLYAAIQQPGTTHATALRFAERAGQLLADVFAAHTDSATFLTGNNDVLIDAIVSMLKVDHDAVSAVADAIQLSINKAAGLGLRPVSVPFDLDRAAGLGKSIAAQSDRPSAISQLQSDAINFSQHVVDESLRANADFQWRSGMSPKIVRKTDSGACAWCKALAGVYDYADVSDRGNDVFRRHRDCNCTVEYIADKTAQNVWNKKKRTIDADRQTRLRSAADALARRREEDRQKRITLTQGGKAG